MRWSNLFAPTLREAPADAEASSHRLLLRAGYIRQLGAGIYSVLPLARRSLLKIERIVRDEMDKIGAQEFYLPALNPDDVWKASGRWEAMGDNLFKLRDRSGRELCLAMTHEEVFTTIARDELRSYRNLPQIWYQIQLKFRDEPRPKSGLLRVRQFMMKDSYSFDLDDEGLDHSYSLHDQAYKQIFDRCGLEYRIIEAHSGAMGGSESEEFVVFSDAGEDWVVSCGECDYAANLERAISRVPKITDPQETSMPEEVHTPGQKTIEEVSEFLQLPRSQQIKSLVYIVDSKPCLLLLRGDHQLSETKLASALGSEVFRPALPEEIREAFGADPGSLGPVGIEGMQLIADQNLRNRKNLVCGANRDDYHLLNVTPDVDFEPMYVDIREVEAGDLCPNCGSSLGVARAIEIGHIFKLGRKYSTSMGATVLSKDGQEVPVVMGSYGIGIERILAAAIELYNDKDGIVLPRSIAPFQVIISLLRPADGHHREIAEQLYRELNEKGVDTLLDDRDERPGVKFKDAELIGIPIRITIGKKLEEGEVELFTRREKESETVQLASAVSRTVCLLEQYPL
jgi:prolyl-tRNA synthetase